MTVTAIPEVFTDAALDSAGITTEWEPCPNCGTEDWQMIYPTRRLIIKSCLLCGHDRHELTEWGAAYEGLIAS